MKSWSGSESSEASCMIRFTAVERRLTFGGIVRAEGGVRAKARGGESAVAVTVEGLVLVYRIPHWGERRTNVYTVSMRCRNRFRPCRIRKVRVTGDGRDPSSWRTSVDNDHMQAAACTTVARRQVAMSARHPAHGGGAARDRAFARRSKA